MYLLFSRFPLWLLISLDISRSEEKKQNISIDISQHHTIDRHTLFSGVLSDRNRIPAKKKQWRKFLKFLKFVEIFPRWVDFSAEFPSRIQNQQIYLISLYACKGNLKWNQANRLILDSRGKFHTKIDPSRGIFDEFQNFQKCSSLFFCG